MASRAQPTPLSEWWRTVDRLTLAALGALMLGGIVLCLAASPPVAARLGLDPFHFVNRQVFFLVPAAAVLVATSFLPPREIRTMSSRRMSRLTLGRSIRASSLATSCRPKA